MESNDQVRVCQKDSGGIQICQRDLSVNHHKFTYILHDKQLIVLLLPVSLTSSLSLDIIINSLTLNYHGGPFLTLVHLIRQDRPWDHRLCRWKDGRKDHIYERGNDETKNPRERIRSFPNPNGDRGIDAIDEAWQVGSYAHYESGDGPPVDAVGVTVYAVATNEQVFRYRGVGVVGHTLRDGTKQ